MSLQRIASLETFVNVPTEGRRSRQGSVSSVAASERARKLTFNPLPESWNPAFVDDRDHHLAQSRGAFEVPQWKRIRECLIPPPFFFSIGTRAARKLIPRFDG